DVRRRARPRPIRGRHRRGARRVRAPGPPHDRRGASAVGRRLAHRPASGVAVVKFAVTIGDTTEMVEVSGEAGTYRLTIRPEGWEVDVRLTAQGIYSLLSGGGADVA